MTLDDLVLHSHTRDIAGKVSTKLPHGLIIDGAVGSGVVTVAKTLAQSIDSLVFVIEPKKKVKGEFVVDAREGSIIIEDIRRLYGQTRTRQPGKQVYIIDTGEKSMTIAAQNAFLKLLEEPRSGVHFIIATHKPDLLLPTIISRTQRLSLLSISDEQTATLIDTLGIKDVVKRARLAFVGRGLPALIHRLATDETQYEARVTIMGDAKQMLGTDAYQKIGIIYKYRDNRSDTLTLLDDMNNQLRTVIKSQPNQRLARTIDNNLRIRESIAAGGNIRLQLMAGIL